MIMIPAPQDFDNAPSSDSLWSRAMPVSRDPYPKKDTDLMERTQCNAARFITGGYRSSGGGRPGLPVPNRPCGLRRRESTLNWSAVPGSVTRFLKKTKLQPLEERHHLLRLCSAGLLRSRY